MLVPVKMLPSWEKRSEELEGIALKDANKQIISFCHKSKGKLVVNDTGSLLVMCRTWKKPVKKLARYIFYKFRLDRARAWIESGLSNWLTREKPIIGHSHPFNSIFIDYWPRWFQMREFLNVQKSCKKRFGFNIIRNRGWPVPENAFSHQSFDDGESISPKKERCQSWPCFIYSLTQVFQYSHIS